MSIRTEDRSHPNGTNPVPRRLPHAGFAVVSPGTASANDACEDFIRMMIVYDEMGDRATADAIWDNLRRDGCV
jgi:hypothetical protein